ncbi:MAG: hypothetical protein VXY37_01875 [Bacteroidota bacterium]|nr:hypothetical protein [Bacteroidota bacterium]
MQRLSLTSKTFRQFVFFLFLSLGTSTHAQVFEPMMDSSTNAMEENAVRVLSAHEAQIFRDSLRKDSIVMLGEELAFLLLLKQESNPADSSTRENMIAYIDKLIRRIDQKIRILENQMVWKDAYDIAVILPFRSDVMPSALEQWELEIAKVMPNAANLTMPKSLFQNYDLYDGIMSYLSYRLDTSIQLNLSVWDNLNSVDSNQAILNLLEQNPPDFIIGPGFGGKSNSMLRSTLLFAEENGAAVFDPGCTKLDTSMLNGNYIGYQPSYLETFYSSLEVAARKDSSAYIIVFQPDTNPQYNKLLADMEAAVYAFNERFNTRLTPVTYGLLKGESLDSLKSKCLVSGRKSFIHYPTKRDQLVVRFYELFSPIIKDTSSATAVGLEEWLDTKQLEYHKVLKTNLIIPSYERKEMTCLPQESIYQIRQATNLNPSESFKLGYEIMTTIDQGVRQGGKVFLSMEEDSLTINPCDTSANSIDFEQVPFFYSYPEVDRTAYWQSYGIQWMKLAGIEAVPYLD